MTLLSAPLICHPDSPSTAIHRVNVTVCLRDGRSLFLTFTPEGDVARVRLPPPASPRRAEGLWRHTCFEAFIGAEGSPAYCELNFAPSGEWAAYAFRSYRDGGILQCERDPLVSVSVMESSLRLEATLALDALSLPASSPLRLGLSAVIEEESGFLTYWALRHPPGRPDFHHAGAFALRLVPGTGDDE